VLGGLLLIPFAEPPTRFWSAGDELSGDWRPTLLALALLAACVAILRIDALRAFFELAPLRAIDYAIIAGVAVAWAYLLRFTWRKRLLDRFLSVDLG
jgi:cation-transporting ATPase E